MKLTTLAIIGTAGRKEDGIKLASNPKRYYDRMLECARKAAELVGADTLYSGAAAWADFMAIALYLEGRGKYGLVLHVPESLYVVPSKGRAFTDTGEVDWRKNPGGTANHYLRQFANQCQPFMGESFPWSQYEAAVSDVKATKCLTRGFKERNLEVAKADHCLAMTFGDKHRVKDGGTAHTVGAFLAREGHGRSFHVDLNTLKAYEGAVV